MVQYSIYPAASLSVSEITRYISNVIGGDEILNNISVIGEVSNLSRPGSGHIYFTLKDSFASLRCVIWKPNAAQLSFSLRDGISLQVHGYIGVYERSGQYQLYADTVRPAGEGFLYQEFMRLKERLETEGLFDPGRKRLLPPIPRKIGIVTSPTGAALQDILNTLSRRFTLAELVLAPCQVQGEDASRQIIAAIQTLNQIEQPDLIIVARGGGSLEDLFAFNDEGVVRAIANSRAPVVTGIGHETDFTLADFAADVRAPTPTGSAIAATPDSIELSASLQSLKDRLQRTYQIRLMDINHQLANIHNGLERGSPHRRIENDRQRLDEFNEYLFRSATYKTGLLRVKLQGLVANLSALNPYSVLKRGYAILSTPSGRIISSVNQVSEKDKFQVRLSDGTFGAVALEDIVRNKI
jgi:exodeoxyribonuclease VII large subunit